MRQEAELWVQCQPCEEPHSAPLGTQRPAETDSCRRPARAGKDLHPLPSHHEQERARRSQVDAQSSSISRMCPPNKRAHTAFRFLLNKLPTNYFAFFTFLSMNARNCEATPPRQAASLNRWFSP